VYWGTSSGLSLFWMSPTLPGETGQWHEPALARARSRPPRRTRRCSTGWRACIPWTATAGCASGPWRTSARARRRTPATWRPNTTRLFFSARCRPGLTRAGHRRLRALQRPPAGGPSAGPRGSSGAGGASLPPETVPVALFARARDRRAPAAVGVAADAAAAGARAAVARRAGLDRAAAVPGLRPASPPGTRPAPPRPAPAARKSYFRQHARQGQ
jgi:hypothetical protein